MINGNFKLFSKGGDILRGKFLRFFAGKTLVPILALSLGAVSAGKAQKYIEEREQTWLGFSSQSRFTDKSGLWVDLHLRFADHYIREKTMFLSRLGYIYYINDVMRLSGGYTYAHRYSQAGVRRLPEHRPWQQIQWVSRKRRFELAQTTRVEQRFRKESVDGFRSEGYSFNWRLRYNIAFTIPITGKSLVPKTSYLFLSHEINVNAGKNIVYNYFDQYRSFAGLGYQFNSKLHANVGHLFIFQQDPRERHFGHTHAIRLFVYYNFDFRAGGI